jgi:lipopolysaccharide export LptBFGC system permease protein LptF
VSDVGPSIPVDPLVLAASTVVERDVLAASSDVDRHTLAASNAVDRDVLAAKRKNSINFLWEVTQAVLAFMLVAAVVKLALGEQAIDESLKTAMFLVIGFYFGRTNHTRPTPTRPYGED